MQFYRFITAMKKTLTPKRFPKSAESQLLTTDNAQPELYYFEKSSFPSFMSFEVSLASVFYTLTIHLRSLPCTSVCYEVRACTTSS